MVNGGTGFPTESRTPEPAEISILMGQELPEQHRLMGSALAGLLATSQESP
jgi:hypothetical protein